jgi:hypothetical protein
VAFPEDPSFREVHQSGGLVCPGLAGGSFREGLSGIMSWNYDGIAKHHFEAKVRRVAER